MTAATNTSTAQIDTGRVAGRRTLRFNSLDEMLAEVDRLVEADRAGRLKQLGNWPLGQTLGHLAGWAEYAYTPAPLKTPWFIRAILRLMKRKYLYGSLTPGVRIPKVPGGTLATEPMRVEDALPRLQRAIERLKSEAPTAPSSAFGWLSHDEAIALNLRHAELHLSFLIPNA